MTMLEEKPEIVIAPSKGWARIDFKDLFDHRDLIFLMVGRDFAAKYRQTILGPAWFVIQPLLTTIVFTVIFGNVAKISTDGTPKFLFYLSGLLGWGYFSGVLNHTGNIFVTQKGLMTKVYFPRLVLPLTASLSQLIALSIQIATFLGFYTYYLFFTAWGDEIRLNWVILLFPLMILQAGVLGLGVGFITSAASAKYRDLNFLLSFLVQIWMYATPIIYPFSKIPEKYQLWMALNPMTTIVETIKYGFLGVGGVSMANFLISLTVSLAVFFFGAAIFKRTERRFVDTV
ncbi:MAG: ABC transporter permease [Opitutaceae bacterium]